MCFFLYRISEKKKKCPDTLDYYISDDVRYHNVSAQSLKLSVFMNKSNSPYAMK